MMVIDQNKSIDIKTVQKIAKQGEKVSISSSTLKNMAISRKNIEKIIQSKAAVYGVTTGFGAFKNVAIPTSDVNKLQENLILSHATGVGESFDESTVRAIMFIIANYLSKGYSGVRVKVVEKIIEFLNAGITPIVPEKGSVGSSGDLAPSAHIVLALIGKGEVTYKNKLMGTGHALKLAHIDPLKLEAKEGLGLINNTATMCANSVLALYDAIKIANLADIAGSLSAQALLCTDKAFDERIHLIKPHKGQILVAKRMREMLSKSKMLDNSKVQDQYSIRCIPQIHGAVRESISFADNIVQTEINSVTDNPLIFVENDKCDVISGGNFHGEILAIAMDTLAMGISELANIADRRIASLLDPATNNRLPAFLAKNGGINSGLMILQYTTASLVSENKVLAHPASVDSIPTSANVEDLVSMGSISARKVRDIIENVTNTLAIELIVACQAIGFRLEEGYSLSPKSKEIYNEIRKIVPFFENDQVYYPYIHKVYKWIEDNNFETI